MFNKSISRSLFKAISANRLSPNPYQLLIAATKHRVLVYYNKMNFFEYRGDAKNIFLEDEDDSSSKSKDKKKFFKEPIGKTYKNKKPLTKLEAKDSNEDIHTKKSSEFEQHSGNYELHDIPLYITKMKEEIKQIKNVKGNSKGNIIRNMKSYFNKVYNLTAMYNQNSEEIYSKYPKFITTLHEYLWARKIKDVTSTLDSLEDRIVNNDLENIPMAGIRNFLFAKSQAGRGRKEVIDKIITHLIKWQVFTDINLNLSIVNSLSNLRALDSDYLHQSLKAIQQEINNQFDQKLVKLDENIIVDNKLLRKLLETVVKFLADSDTLITPDDVKEFLSRHQVNTYDSNQFIHANDKTETLKDHLILVLLQYCYVYNENPNNYLNLMSLSYFNGEQGKHSKLSKEIPHLGKLIENAIKENSKESERKEIVVKPSPNQLRIENALKEIGIRYSTFQRIGYLFIVDFVIAEK